MSTKNFRNFLTRKTFCIAVSLIVGLMGAITVFPIPFINTNNSWAYEDYKEKVTEYTLKNGIRFIILQDHSAPVISFQVHVDVGAVNEKMGETGIGHLLEHLAFNGTEIIGTKNWRAEKRALDKLDRVHQRLLKAKRESEAQQRIEKIREEFEKARIEAAKFIQTNEFGQIFDRVGAIGPGAYISYDFTCYWVELPSNKFELWALLESDRLLNPVLRGFYEELKVVKEERRMMVENRPWGRLLEEFRAIAYRVHPYGNPIVGHMNDLEQMSRAKVRRFYDKHYTPCNIIIAIVGDVCLEEIIPILERYFGRFPERERPPEVIAVEPPQASERKVTVKMDSEPILIIGYHTVNAVHPDQIVLEIAAEILGGGRTSRLYQRLVKREMAAISTGSWSWTPKYPGMFHLWAVAARDYTNQELKTLIYEEIERLKKEFVSDEELEGAKARMEVNFILGLKSRRGIARELAWHEAVTGDWRNMFKELEEIEKVSREDIKRVVNNYFFPQNRVVGMVEPN